MNDVCPHFPDLPVPPTVARHPPVRMISSAYQVRDLTRANAHSPRPSSPALNDAASTFSSGPGSSPPRAPALS
jgi:hypothetical protein